LSLEFFGCKQLAQGIFGILIEVPERAVEVKEKVVLSKWHKQLQ
jgi:hypothetical protein